MYYLKSVDAFKTTQANQIKRSIASIFEDSDVDFNEELELIFSYKDDKVVFMTLEWFYIFDLDLIIVEEDLTSTTPDLVSYITLKIKKNIPKEKYIKKRHCLWKKC